MNGRILVIVVWAQLWRGSLTTGLRLLRIPRAFVARQGADHYIDAAAD